MSRIKINIEGVFRDHEGIRNQIINSASRRSLLTFIYKILLSGGLYGFIMGVNHSFLQAGVSAIKVPALFFVTLLICIPTLHFIGLILGSRLHFYQSVTVLLWGISVSCILLAAFGPITLFFMLSNSSYVFMMGLHVTIFTICGIVGLHYIKKNFSYIRQQTDLENDSGLNSGSGNILLVWIILYMFVGTQMAFIMSPFVGKESNFLLFTDANHNFYSYLLELLLP